MQKIQLVGWMLLAGTYALWALLGVQVRDKDNSSTRDLGGIERLTRDLEQLSALVDRLEAEVKVQSLVAPAVTPPDQSADVAIAHDEILARLDRLEEVAREMLQSRASEQRDSKDSAENWARFAGSSLGVESLTAYQEAMRDVGGSIDARLDALETLARFPHEMNAIPPMLNEVKDLFKLVDSTSKRVKVVESVDGCVDAAVLDWIASLIADSAEQDLRVRREAAKALRKGAANPQVRIIAQQLFEKEVDPDVRAQLLRAIEG